MKTAIASDDKTKDGDISERAGRSKFYLVFEGDHKLIKVLSNPFSSGGGGAGYGVAKMLKDEGVKKVFVGKAGENMKNAMQEADIKLIEQNSTIQEALDTL